MIFNEHTLSPDLNEYVESLFHYKDLVPEHSKERVVPTGHIFLLFELDGIPRNTFDNRSLNPIATFTKAWVSGMQSGYITISAHDHSEMLVVQFKPAGAHPFFHIPISRLNDRIVPAEEVFGSEILNLRKNLVEDTSPDAKLRVMEDWLTQRFEKEKEPPEALLSALAKIQEESVSNLSKVVSEYPKSQKHLINQFKKYVGLTPKVYQRILRFNEILQRINADERISWTEVAYKCGYSDQSHFIKEFKHFSGFNPQEFIDKDQSRESNFFPVD